MKKKGFTLIELLAVIVIIGVIALIVSPLLIGILKKQEKKTFTNSVNGILRAVRDDLSADDFNVPREYYYEDGVLTLLKVENSDKNEEIKTSGKLIAKGTILVDGDGNIIINICSKDYCGHTSADDPNVSVDKNDETDNPEKDPLDPMITLLGERTVMVGIGKTYTEPGVESKTVSGESLPYTTEIRKDRQVVNSVDTSVVGTYTIVYSNESNGKTASVVRTVKVVEMKPQITMTEPDDGYVNNKSVVIRVVPVAPNTLNSFIYKVNGESNTVNGNNKTVLLNESGEYTIEVTATDSDGNTSTLSKTYRIDSVAPVITVPEETTLSMNEVVGFDLLEGVTVTDDSGETIVPTYSGNLASIPGTYTITYTAVDRANNRTTKERTIVVVKSKGPILNFSSLSTNGYVKSVTVTATATDNIPITSFTYQIIKDGVEQTAKNVNVSGNSGEATITLGESGVYKIKLVATNEENYTSQLESGEYRIDATGPMIVFDRDTVTLTVKNVAGYNLMTGVTVIDHIEGTIDNSKVKVTGNLPASPGSYKITYSASDSLGNTTTKERTFIVKTVEASFDDLVKDNPDIATLDPDGNSRYVGGNPNNYVKFNNELWRIIGVFNGQAKIIRNDFYSTGKSWDKNSAHSDYGWNDWSSASLQTELNGTYLSRIEETSKHYIDQNYTWKLGGGAWTETGRQRANMYRAERGTTVYSGRPTEWTGAIGLMYPSDYGYATNGTNCDTDMNAWYNGGGVNSACYNTNSNWLSNTSYEQWTLTPQGTVGHFVFDVAAVGRIGSNAAASTYSVRPTLYLKEVVKVVDGSGTSSDPFILGTNQTDFTPPIITVPENTTVKITEVATFNLLEGVTVTDDSGETITPKVSGSLSATLGAQIIIYTATDSSGNTATKTRTITVVEAEGPILNFSSISSNNKWVKAQNITVTATDNSNLSSFTYEVIKDGTSQGVKTVSVSGKSASATVALSTDGTYSIKLMGRDQHGNSSTSTSGTYKIDVTKPTITMSNVTIKDNEVAGYNLMTGVTVSDNSGVVPTVKTTGTMSTTPGTYTVTYTVTDEAGNITTKARTITVEASIIIIPDDLPGMVTNDPDGNKRYTGANPNNYVRFNNELWRIIGVFNGQMKIIRNDVYRKMRWHNEAVADWTEASVRSELNGAYLSSIDSISKSYIDQNHIWNLGGSSAYDPTRENIYIRERGDVTYGGRPTTWTGAIGLMYLSDYGYAAGGSCDTSMLTWKYTGDCYKLNWLTISGNTQWTMTSMSNVVGAAFHIDANEITTDATVTTARAIRPTLFLKKSTKINGGSGTSTDPYTLVEKITIEDQISGSDIATLDPDGNKRYVGANPNNYVRFNNELWRIIGVFNGQLKIIRDKSEKSSWNSINNNDWSQSSLQIKLNTTYLDSLLVESKEYIDNTYVWHLGGRSNNTQNRADYYNTERGSVVYKGRPTTWTGAIGLMYVSDYSYASSCLDNEVLSSWRDCMDPIKNWLSKFSSSSNYGVNYTIVSSSGDPAAMYGIRYPSSVSTHLPTSSYSIQPVVYLKINVLIKGGTGTSSDPYILGT